MSPFVVKTFFRFLNHSFFDKKSLFTFFFFTSFLFSQISIAQVETNFSGGGAVRVGDSSTACAPAIEGAIRFDADGANSIDYCDGANWRTLLTNSIGGGVVNNGNSFAAPMIIGTNDANTLSFETGGTTRVTIDTSGNVGINTTTPNSKFHIYGEDSNSALEVGSNPYSHTSDAQGSYFFTVFNSSTVNTGTLSGIFNDVIYSGSRTNNHAYGTNTWLRIGNTGGTSRSIASKSEIDIGATTVTQAFSNEATYTQSAGTVTDGAGYYVGIDNSGGTTTNMHGLYIEPLVGTNRWGVYQAGTNDNNFFGGKVGIGTSNPAVELDVNTGTINAAQICDENNTNCKDISTGWAGGGGDGHSLDAADGSPVDVVFVDNSGKVGIGTTNPTVNLEVMSSSGETRAQFYSTANPAEVTAGRHNGSLASKTNVASGNELGKFVFRGYANNNDHYYAGFMAAVANGAPSGTNVPADLYFSSNTGSGVTEKMRITKTGTVGIGTTSPDQTLSIGDGTALDGGIVAKGFGTVGTNGTALTTAGAGRRMIWYPRKGAFRAGGVDGTQWDDAEIGNYSSGLGFNARATGDNSHAIGRSHANGSGSVAIGSWNYTDWTDGIAIGNNVTTYSTGGIAIGQWVSNQSGDRGIVIGTQADVGSGYGYNSDGINSIVLSAGFAAGTRPRVTGDNTLGIFLGDNSGVDITNDNIMSVMGGNMGIGTTNPTSKLQVEGTTKLGTAGTAFTNMGVCTVASYTPTNTASNQTCTGIPASTGVVVNCSASAAFQSPNTTTMYTRATGTANQIAVNLSAANNVAVTLTCMWMQP